MRINASDWSVPAVRGAASTAGQSSLAKRCSGCDGTGLVVAKRVSTLCEGARCARGMLTHGARLWALVAPRRWAKFGGRCACAERGKRHALGRACIVMQLLKRRRHAPLDYCGAVLLNMHVQP